MNEPTRLELVELDIDTRLAELWAETPAFPQLDLEVLAVFMRAAYARGYADALIDPDPLAFYRRHGYAIPGGGA